MTDVYKGMTHSIVDILSESASKKRQQIKNTYRPDAGPRNKLEDIARKEKGIVPDEDGSNLTKEGEAAKVNEALPIWRVSSRLDFPQEKCLGVISLRSRKIS